MIKRFVHSFNACAKSLVNDLESNVDIGAFDVAESIGIRSTELQMLTSFGTQFDLSTTELIYQNIRKILDIWGSQFINYYVHIVFRQIGKLISVMPTDTRLINENMSFLKPVIKNVHDQYLAELEANKGVMTSEDEFKNKPESFIDKLVRLRHRKMLTDTQMFEHVDTMILAGSDTVQSSVANILLLLAMNPDAQEQCAMEVKDVLGTKVEDDIDLERLHALPILERTIRECLRMIPTVPIILRKPGIDIDMGESGKN